MILSSRARGGGVFINIKGALPHCPGGPFRVGAGTLVRPGCELELELIQTQMAQKPMLRAEVGMRVRCANKASAE